VPLYREHRVVEMLDFHGRLHRMPRASRKTRIEEVLDLVGLRDRRRELIGRLSRGLRQRVALAVALLPDPEVLILDEPTSGLDPLQRIEVRKLLRGLAERRTVLLSSHILPEIEAACPRVLVIHRGRIVADGTPDELVAKLGGAGFVRLEAVVGDVEKALRVLRGIEGVRTVLHRGKLGIHDMFEIHGEGDLREDVGAAAASLGWALRELSSRRPTLEQIFARLTSGLDPSEDGVAMPAGGAAPASGAIPAAGASPASGASPANEPAPRKPAVVTLNPFEKRT
jgi:ABC-2 type transport system ATP-binding protein